MASKFRAMLTLSLLQIAAVAHAQSLFDSDSYRPLATDQRAHEVGDSITVLIYESATATSRADTTAQRSSDLSISAADQDDTWAGNLQSNNDFNGGGVERRTGEVIARVSVTVREVLPNGDLVVGGEQLISLNNESQRISIDGRLRRQDIFSDNTVLSSRLTDAKIEFKGHGMLSSRERPGWLTRFFHWLL